MDLRYVNARIVGLLSNPGFETVLNDVFDWYDQATHNLLISGGAPHVSSDAQFELMSKRVSKFQRAMCRHCIPAFETSIHVEASRRSHVHVSPPRQIRIAGRSILVWKAEVHESLHLVVRQGIEIGRGEELSSGTYEYRHSFLMVSDAGEEAGAEDEAAEDEAVKELLTDEPLTGRGEDLVKLFEDLVNFSGLLRIMGDEAARGRGGSEVEAARGGSEIDETVEDLVRFFFNFSGLLRIMGDEAARGRGGSEVEAARAGSDEDSISDANYEDAATDQAPLSPDHARGGSDEDSIPDENYKDAAAEYLAPLSPNHVVRNSCHVS